MEIVDVAEKWTHRINTVTLGATKEQGGTRTRTVTVGGETTLPFLTFEGEMPHRPVVAGLVVDVVPDTWPEVLREAIGPEINSPAEWAQKCAEDFKVDLICLKLYGPDPSGPNLSPTQAAETVRKVLEAMGLPLIIWGCGDEMKDNEVLPECSQAAKGENCLLGSATDKNYRTMAAIGKADRHKLIAEAPVDINIAKQVNILALDAGFPLEDLVIYPSTGALGYGIEYVYSIMERTRLAGLGGDKLLAQPILCDIGAEAWAVKEARATKDEQLKWGDERLRGPLWEATTAYVYLLAGADILVMRHPRAVQAVKKMIRTLMAGGKG